MPLHSILIPNRGRNQNLLVSLNSIAHSAEVCGVWNEIEVVVVGDDPYRDGDTVYTFVRVVPFTRLPPVELGPNEPMPFWKTAYLNAGIEAARGEVLSFLDADAIVGPRWLESVQWTNHPTLTKLAYRVRYIHRGQPILWEHYDDGRYPLAYEAYGAADRDCSRLDPEKDCAPWGKPFGNSQFSIRRDVLGDLRFDERYIGRGYDDLHFSRLLAEHYGDRYRAEIVTDGPHAMFHIKHPQVAGFSAGPWNQRSERIFYSKPVTWYVCPDAEAAEAVLAKDPHARVTWPPNDRWHLSLAIPGLDTIVKVEEDTEGNS